VPKLWAADLDTSYHIAELVVSSMVVVLTLDYGSWNVSLSSQGRRLLEVAAFLRFDCVRPESVKFSLGRLEKSL